MNDHQFNDGQHTHAKQPAAPQPTTGAGLVWPFLLSYFTRVGNYGDLTVIQSEVREGHFTNELISAAIGGDENAVKAVALTMGSTDEQVRATAAKLKEAIAAFGVLPAATPEAVTADIIASRLTALAQ